MSAFSPPLSHLLIGCGAGFSGDRVDAPQAVVEHLVSDGRPAVLMLETLGERTLALAQKARLAKPDSGFEPLLEQLVGPVLKRCLDAHIPIVGNFGAANPRGAAALVRKMAEEQGARVPRIAVVEGDDLRDRLSALPLQPWEGTPPGYELPVADVVAANAYLGALPIAQALAEGADVVVTGRVADPALALGPMLNAFGWSLDDHDLLAIGTMAGHLLECGSQITGGYFADPGHKDVPDLANIGFPIAEITSDGRVRITKAAGTGGRIDVSTGREQLLYEVHDPKAYITPDVTADISAAEITEVGEGWIQLSGVSGTPPTDTYKVTVSLRGGWLGEGEISYAGPNATARARLAINTLRDRLTLRDLKLRTRFDLIGVASVFDNDEGVLQSHADDAQDVRVRMAVEGPDREVVEAATQEVIALLCCGPAGGGGVRRSHVERIHTVSYLVPKDSLKPTVDFI
ncbi:acyclic terpene utilization AtuA family protein [Sulfitobacter sp. 1A16787]|uniref:acyclic terpene utilization AtuA family protein n=1 Tax=Sulfitobacter sp. 1A16787 TaxID=3368571 RepID=UPI003745877E